MIEQKHYETKCYKYNEYIIKITKIPYIKKSHQSHDGYYEASLEHEDYGVHITMFGTACTDWEEMEEMVENEIYDYIVSLWETINKIEADA